MHAVLEILRAFLKLGVSSFGGPVAHLGYFREEFVVRRRWLDDAAYADLVALCQLLPGPVSSQVGFSIGLMRGGFAGALAAWSGFTLPSAVLMVLFARAVPSIPSTLREGMLHGLKLVAVAIVAQAVFGMARVLCPDGRRATIAVVAAAIVLAVPGSWAQIAAIIWGGAAGLSQKRLPASSPLGSVTVPVSRGVALASLAVFSTLLLASLPMPGTQLPFAVSLFQAFYRSGALVFGGGHVILPLLRDAFVTPGWVSEDTFLAGYGAAQAVPGPMSSFAAYLGAVAGAPPLGIAGAALGLAAIFLPGLLIVVAVLPFWRALRTLRPAQSCIAGINAAVVGILAAALYTPLCVSSIRTPGDAALAAAGFFLLWRWRVPPVAVVLAGVLAGIALSLMAR